MSLKVPCVYFVVDGVNKIFSTISHSIGIQFPQNFFKAKLFNNKRIQKPLKFGIHGSRKIFLS